MKKLSLLNLFVFSQLFSFAQDTAKSSLDGMSLEQLLNIKVTLASGQEQDLKDAPGMLTVIYSDEIRYSGARDLMDVLRNVPGLFFAQDLENVISMGVRGIWAQEGKILLMRDGIELHETAYNSLQFLQHYPLHQLDRIEIIRGPGSVLYGGNAGLCVINLITLKDSENDGLKVGALYSRLERADGQKTAWMRLEKNFKNGFGMNISGHYSDGIFSDRIASVGTDSTARKIDLKNFSGTSTASVNASFWYKNFELRYMLDDNRHQSVFENYRYQHLTHLISLRQKIVVGDKLVITPQIWQKQMYPWRYLNAPDSYRQLNTFNKRTEASLIARYAATGKWSLLAGARWMEDRSEFTEADAPYLFQISREKDIRFNTWSLFLQSENYFSDFLLTSGIRYEKHNQYGAVLVPRINLTGKIRNWDFDLQYNEAFRAPSILNMDINPDIKPERTTDFEMELGRKIGRNFKSSVILFYTQISNPIIYTYIDGREKYFNDVAIKTYGAEAEVIFRNTDTELGASYSSYFSMFDSPVYSVREKENSKIGMPNHKVSFSARRFFGKHFFLSPQFLFFSRTFGYNSADQLLEQRAMSLVTFSGGFRNIANHWDVSFSVSDILNEQFVYFQAYRSGSDPLPGQGRAINMKVIYNLPLKP